MRLIDADELIEMAYRMRLDSREQIACMIESAPTIEPEQKRGKWIVIMNEPNITFDECKCSECGVIEYFNKGWKKFSFCPNCGARMDIERE